MGIGLPVLGVPIWGRRKVAEFTCTTTAAQTLTIQGLTVATGQSVTVYWGDGTSNAYTAGAGTRTHDYAGAGTWKVYISNPTAVTLLNLSDAKLSGAAGQIAKFTALTSLTITSLPSLIVGAGEIGQLINLTNLNLSTCPNVTIAAGEIGLLINLTVASLQTMANVTVAAGEIDNLIDLTSLTLYNCANVTIGAAEFGVLTNLTALTAVTMTNLAMQTGLANLLKLTTLSYKNSLSQAQVDSVLQQMYAAFPTRTGTAGTIDVSTTNAAPSGVYQAQCPPGTGKEYAYELVNDSCAVSPNHWATVTTS